MGDVPNENDIMETKTIIIIYIQREIEKGYAQIYPVLFCP